MNEKPYFPLFVDLSQKRITVAGGGTIAKRRIETLLPFVGRITVIAPKLHPALLGLLAEGRIDGCCRPVEPEDFETADLVLAATDSSEKNDEIWQICKERNICVNIASDREKCDFYFPGILRQEEIVVGINAGGRNHKKARQFREHLQRLLEQETGEESYDG